MPYTTLIIDFDGVVADTNESVADYLAKTFFRSKYWALTKVFETALHNYPNKLSWIRKFFSTGYYNYLIKQNSLGLQETELLKFQPVLDTLRDLPHKNILLTSNYQSTCELILGQDKDTFSQMITFDNVISKSQGLEFLSDQGLDLGTCLFITDTLGDIEEFQQHISAEQIYGVTWGFHPNSVLSIALPDNQIFQKFSDLDRFANNNKALD